MHDNKHGFTLVELIIVLAVLVILTTITATGIISLISTGTMRRQNDYARTIFLAAQSRLTWYEEQGQLTRFTALVTGSASDLAAPEETYVVPGEAGSDQQRWFLSVGRGDYHRYRMMDHLSAAEITELTYEMQQIKALYDLLDPYIMDKSILEHAAICIELNPDPQIALVFAVYYTDQENISEFTYHNIAADDQISITSLDASARREWLIGYYNAGNGQAQ